MRPPKEEALRVKKLDVLNKALLGKQISGFSIEIVFQNTNLGLKVKLGHCSSKGFSWIKVMEGIRWDLDEFPKHMYAFLIFPFPCEMGKE